MNCKYILNPCVHAFHDTNKTIPNNEWSNNRCLGNGQGIPVNLGILKKNTERDPYDDSISAMAPVDGMYFSGEYQRVRMSIVDKNMYLGVTVADTDVYGSRTGTVTFAVGPRVYASTNDSHVNMTNAVDRTVFMLNCHDFWPSYNCSLEEIDTRIRKDNGFTSTDIVDLPAVFLWGREQWDDAIVCNRRGGYYNLRYSGLLLGRSLFVDYYRTYGYIMSNGKPLVDEQPGDGDSTASGIVYFENEKNYTKFKENNGGVSPY